MTARSGRRNRKRATQNGADSAVRRHSGDASLPLPPESFEAEAVTVAWMVCTLFTTLVNLVLLVFGAAWVSGYRDPQGELLGRLILGAGMMVAPITLLLTYFARKLRNLPPPPSLVVAAVLGSVFPFGLLLLLILRASF